jgi:putative sterol carrier protein
MTEQFTYMTQPWRDEGEKRLKAEITPERMNFVTSSVTYIYKNCPPDGSEKYLHFKFVDGRFDVMSVGQGEPPKAEFSVTGDYEIFGRVTRGEMNAQRALMTLKFKLKGNMVKALKLASLADRINKVLATIPAQY